MAYRRDRNIRDLYEERIMGRTLPAPYQRIVNVVDRRHPFRRPEDDYDRDTDVNYGRRGGGGFHEHRAGHGERGPYGGEKRSEPAYRREDPYVYNRGFTEEHASSRQDEFRSSSRGNSSSRGQRAPPRPLLNLPHRGDNSPTYGTTNPDRRGDRESQKRKSSFSPARDHPPLKREEPPSSSARSSRSYSPEGSKNNQTQPSQPKTTPIQQEKERPPSSLTAESGDASPHSSVLATKEEVAGAVVEQVKETKAKEDPEQTAEAHRAHVIANKALEIEKLYRQDCETFGMVVKMLVAKQPTLEKQLETALKENLVEIKERCLEDLRQFISEVNVVLQSDQDKI
ncbi:periphilin-1 [Astyanax mexicanus]|uniref:periphilin-1 n=1 Tax=Astyanax mexicanus TaxID=7994 RepID=UPI0020CACFFC|nr:periphilin-1 [Astyanax mexicanus]